MAEAKSVAVRHAGRDRHTQHCTATRMSSAEPDIGGIMLAARVAIAGSDVACSCGIF